MARKKKKVRQIETIIGILVLFILTLGALQSGEIQNYFSKNKKVVNPITAEESQNVVLEGEDILQIHFFDVGQADSILLISDGKTILIDAGNNEDGELVVSNIKNLGITKLDYVVGTHPHEDHIGGLDDVISNFEIGTIYMPKVQTNTKTFEDVLDTISSKNLNITTPKQGNKFMVGKVECEILLAPEVTKEVEENLNLSSIVIRASYKEQSYLFMADAEKENENARTWEQSNVLKVGHHGSDTSTSTTFLNQVLPQIAIISVGKDNSYNHPSQATLSKLSKLGTLVYRTDEKGNILIESDGIQNKVSFY